MLFFLRYSDGDFTGLGAFRDDLYRNPQYIHSPFGSWLAISNSPTSDSFSQWFRSDSARNIHYEEKLQLVKKLETDSNGNPVFRHFNDKFFPVDGRGWGAEGQRDCFTNALRNYGYVLCFEGSSSSSSSSTWLSSSSSSSSSSSPPLTSLERCYSVALQNNSFI